METKELTLSQSVDLDAERLLNLELIHAKGGRHMLSIRTTHRDPVLIVNSISFERLRPLVAQGNQFRGQRVVTLTINESGQSFELVLAGGFRIYTIS